MVEVQGIEIPVRAESRPLLLQRLEQVLGRLMDKVSVSAHPVTDGATVIRSSDILHFRERFSGILN